MQNTSWSGPPAPSAHVHKPLQQVLKPGDSLALRKVQHPHNGRTCVNRLPLMKQDILSHYSSCFEGIRCFPGKAYKFHLKPEHKPARHAPRKVLIHPEDAFKEEIKSLVELGILQEVKEHTDLVNLFVIVEKDSGSQHLPNHTIKRKLRICLNPRDLNEASEREPYHTCSVDEITAKLKYITVFTIVDFKKGYWMVVLHPDSRKLTNMVLLWCYIHKGHQGKERCLLRARNTVFWPKMTYDIQQLIEILVEKIAHGHSGCPGHFAIQAGFHLYWHGRCHRNC